MIHSTLRPQQRRATPSLADWQTDNCRQGLTRRKSKTSRPAGITFQNPSEGLPLQYFLVTIPIRRNWPPSLAHRVLSRLITASRDRGRTGVHSPYVTAYCHRVPRAESRAKESRQSPHRCLAVW